MDKFEEYKFFAQNTWDLSNRRIATTSTYLTVNIVIFAIIAFLVKDVAFRGWWLVLAATPISVVGGIISGVWWAIIERHREFIRWRFDQLMEMEEQMADSHQMYLREWREFYDPDRKLPEGQKSKRFEFTLLEKRMPQLFMALYIIIWLSLISATALGWR